MTWAGSLCEPTRGCLRGRGASVLRGGLSLRLSTAVIHIPPARRLAFSDAFEERFVGASCPLPLNEKKTVETFLLGSELLAQGMPCSSIMPPTFHDELFPMGKPNAVVVS